MKREEEIATDYGHKAGRWSRLGFRVVSRTGFVRQNKPYFAAMHS